ncbi:MAG: hypothetical protein H6828_06385 [Planctomycetes bacterium]|nr:hypothetical protein [Planctomycetota bacterium]
MKHDCQTCLHFKRAPYEAPRTGCYHPDLMVSKQKDPVLDQQQLPGDHRALNLHGDCTKYEARPAQAPLWKRLLVG